MNWEDAAAVDEYVEAVRAQLARMLAILDAAEELPSSDEAEP